MPSTGTDRRYSNLGDEIKKHYTLKPDWSEDKVFIGLLKVLDDEDIWLALCGVNTRTSAPEPLYWNAFIDNQRTVQYLFCTVTAEGN